MDSHDHPQTADEPRRRGGPDSSPSGRSRDLPAPRLARTILLAVLLSYTLITVLNILDAGLSSPAVAAAVAALLAILGLQLTHSATGADRAPLPRRCLSLGAQALLTYLPIVSLRAEWGSMAGFLAASLLLLLRPPVAWTMYGAVGLSMLVPPVLDGRPVADSVYLCLSTLITGLVVYGLSRLAELVQEVHATRGELAHLAVTSERLRFSRDLHDLLGFSLSAITLKSELINRLIPTHPERAMSEIEEVLSISRQSLADVRRVASGFREMSLEQEIKSAQSVLGAADIEVRVEVSLGRISPQSDTVLATALREAVTNLLRHSKADHCAVEAVRQHGRVRLSVINDGVDPAYRDLSPHSGSGLGNLESRLRSVGGSLTSGRAEDRTFRLVAEAPA
ncbi:sensor histidine kinase [Streptomyces sp. NPDC003016]